MRQFVLILLFLFFFSPVNAKIITGEVEYNAENAGEEVFYNSLKSVNFEYIRPHLIDANANENISLLMSGITNFQNRKLAIFSDGSYGVMYFDDPCFSWYYKNGRLINFTQKSSVSYPAKTAKYKPDGSIVNVGLKVSPNESFIYSSDGKLIAHWIGKFCYDANNNIIMTRKNLE